MRGFTDVSHFTLHFSFYLVFFLAFFLAFLQYFFGWPAMTEFGDTVKSKSSCLMFLFKSSVVGDLVIFFHLLNKEEVLFWQDTFQYCPDDELSPYIKVCLEDIHILQY